MKRFLLFVHKRGDQVPFGMKGLHGSYSTAEEAEQQHDPEIMYKSHVYDMILNEVVVEKVSPVRRNPFLGGPVESLRFPTHTGDISPQPSEPFWNDPQHVERARQAGAQARQESLERIERLRREGLQNYTPFRNRQEATEGIRRSITEIMTGRGHNQVSAEALNRVKSFVTRKIFYYLDEGTSLSHRVDEWRLTVERRTSSTGLIAFSSERNTNCAYEINLDLLPF